MYGVVRRMQAWIVDEAGHVPSWSLGRDQAEREVRTGAGWVTTDRRRRWAGLMTGPDSAALHARVFPRVTARGAAEALVPGAGGVGGC